MSEQHVMSAENRSFRMKDQSVILIRILEIFV